jgi:hypothetical protein
MVARKFDERADALDDCHTRLDFQLPMSSTIDTSSLAALAAARTHTNAMYVQRMEQAAQKREAIGEAVMQTLVANEQRAAEVAKVQPGSIGSIINVYA